MPSSSMKKYIKSPDQNESDKYPETNPEDTEIHNLNNKEFKTAIIKKTSTSYKKTQKDKLVNSGASSQKRFKL